MSEPINDGGPAFPSQAFSQEAGATQPLDEGMSLRDWFAGQVVFGRAYYDSSVRDLAATAYQIADAMLAEREKRKT